jgi:Ca-activated chloride channel homolog
MKNKLIVLLTLFTLISCNECDKIIFEQCPDDPIPEEQFYLYMDYLNPNKTNPQVTIDTIQSDPQIVIDRNKNFGTELSGNFVSIFFDNVRVISPNGKKNYIIKKIIGQEQINNTNFAKDTEFDFEFDPVTTLDVVLVLDVSKSLGSDFKRVKNFAKQFVETLFNRSNPPSVGIVSFSTGIQVFPLSTNEIAIKNFISGQTQGDFTKLYEAMNIGLFLLKNSLADSKAMVTFTDGRDNFSELVYTPDTLIKQMKKPDANNVTIQSFSIGLTGLGGINEPVLKSLAVNGRFASPNNFDELGVVFNQFGKAISNVYSVIYIRNNQQVIATKRIRFKFNVQAK